MSAGAQDAFESSNLPIVIIDTEGVEIPDDPKIRGRMQIIDNGPGERNRVTDPPNDYDGVIGIEVRGTSSQAFPKKQYGFETWDEDGEDIDASLLGMPEEEDWILHAPYADKSLMRNVLAYHLARATGRYASRTAFCEVVLNGEYVGVYVLMEKIKRDDNRVDISRLRPEETEGDDRTGGYIVEMDRPATGWISPYPAPYSPGRPVFYNFEVPSREDMVPEQAQYIIGRFHAFESAMASVDPDDPTTGYPAHIDVDSFVDYLIVNELARNIDAYRLSTFFHKDKDSVDPLIQAGPVWDFNIAFGNADYHDGEELDGFQHEFSFEDPYPIAFWWNRLATSPAFNARMEARWADLRQGAFHDDSLRQFIADTASRLDEAQARNFERWPVLGVTVPPNAFVGDTYAEEVDYLTNWVTSRAARLDRGFVTTSELPPEASGGIELSGLLPNPVRKGGYVRLRVDRPQIVRVDAFDVRGRLVASVFDEYVRTASVHSVPLDASALAPGLYVIRVTGETGTAVRRFAVAR